MKIKLNSVNENVSKSGNKYWKVKLIAEDGSKVSFIVDCNQVNYDALFQLQDKEIEVEEAKLPAITARGVYEGHPYATREIKGSGINDFMKVFNVTFNITSALESFFKRGFNNGNY